MKTLIFTAHPSADGFTHKIAAQYAGTKKTKGGEAEIINLYDEQWKLDFLTFPEKKSASSNAQEGRDFDDDEFGEEEEEESYGHGRNSHAALESMQQKISESDELVFIFPLWWSEAPAVMKNMIDNVFAAGFAFEFEKGKSTPKKLLAGKTAQVFVTCDAPKIYYWFKGYPFKTTWKDFILGFCGVKLQNFTVFDKMRERSEKEKNEILEKVTTIALR
jgi:putative NADPH-quinone reductase